MDAVLNWAGIVGAVWLAVSILLGLFWAVAGRRIFRKPPQPPAAKGDDVNGVVFTGDFDTDRRQLDRLNGGGF
jgi:hypothetical protein